MCFVCLLVSKLSRTLAFATLNFSPFLCNSFSFWNISTPAGYRVYLVFNAFNTESGADFVTVFDGPSTTSTQLGQYSGNSLPDNLTSTGSAMLVRFTSNAVNALTGFTATESLIAPPCNGTQVITTSGSVLSEVFGTYFPNMSCTWNITAPAENLVTLTFSSFATEAGYDTLAIYDTSTAGGAFLVANYSGTSLPPPTVSFGSSVMVVWTSNGAVQLDGFSAMVTFATIPLCAGNTTVTASGTILTEGAGTYANNMNCYWLITAPVGYLVNVAFLTFSTEASYDYVRLYDGSSTAATLLGQLSGTTLPSSVRSSQPLMLVRFNSDGSNTNTGFTALVTFVPFQCSGTLTFTTSGSQFTTSTGAYVNNAVW